ncbi:lipase family protein [Nocardia sp. CDC160]|uniref:lipase family protein n=1 Tax=Nocardia sp. CDC160 TaxID=3112166 RepID=UPI002DBF7F51|nr:lipase family protein [Nocardia sp. CDC160]MEC3920165.1 lipase family protein [Nocardia sp. CDC160]
MGCKGLGVLAVAGAIAVGGVFVPATASARDSGVGTVVDTPVTMGWGGLERARNIRYVTEGPTGATTVATGILALPTGPAPRGGWPVVAWDHGSRGLDPSCGITAYPGPDAEIVRRFVDLGYAVVAPDYVGLGPGTVGPHPYQHGRTEATATIDLVRAARQAEPNLSKSWAVAGVSQGGHAALNTGNTAPIYAPELDFRGTIALAPASNIDNVLPLAGPSTPGIPGTADIVGIFAAVMVGLQTAQPDFDLDAYLTPAGKNLLTRLRTTCVQDWGTVVGSDSFATILARPLSTGEFPNRLRKYTAVPTSGYHQPIFLGQGTTDLSVPLPATQALATAFQASATDYQFHTYDTDHQGIPYAAWNDLTDFLTHILPPR